MIKSKFLTLAGAALLALPPAALPQSEDQLVERYTQLAGTMQNATSLVAGLRDGKEVTLSLGTQTETFTPPTGKMGYGNVDNALALAEASLAKQGITGPTPAELSASLMEILKLRADGQGWGQVAHTLGFKLGQVKRPEKTERAGLPDKPERPQRPDRPERPERPGKPR